MANRDPGVVNWLDPGGLREGILMLRWQLLSEELNAIDEPGVTVRKVRAADLPDILPPTVRRIGSVAQRREQLAARGAAYARRFEERDIR